MIINIQHIKWTHPYIIYGYILCIQNIYDDELNNCCHDTTLKWAADHDTAGRVTNAMSSVP